MSSMVWPCLAARVPMAVAMLPEPGILMVVMMRVPPLCLAQLAVMVLPAGWVMSRALAVPLRPGTWVRGCVRVGGGWRPRTRPEDPPDTAVARGGCPQRVRGKARGHRG